MPERPTIGWIVNRAEQLADLAARLKWAYPDTTPGEHMRSAPWIADVTAWARLGGRR